MVEVLGPLKVPSANVLCWLQNPPLLKIISMRNDFKSDMIKVASFLVSLLSARGLCLVRF